MKISNPLVRATAVSVLLHSLLVLPDFASLALFGRKATHPQLITLIGQLQADAQRFPLRPEVESRSGTNAVGHAGVSFGPPSEGNVGMVKDVLPHEGDIGDARAELAYRLALARHARKLFQYPVADGAREWKASFKVSFDPKVGVPKLELLTSSGEAGLDKALFDALAYALLNVALPHELLGNGRGIGIEMTNSGVI